MKKQIKGHQGDVQFRYVDTLPKDAIPISQRPIALGEHSGHQHVLTGDVQLFDVGGTTFAKIGAGKARLQHVHESNFVGYADIVEQQKADHGSILLEEGIVELWIQSGYNPYSKLMESVED